MTTETKEANLAAHLSELARETTDLFHQEIELARAEVKEGVSEVKKGVSQLGSAGALLFAGLLFLLAGVTLLVGLWIPLWVSALIVGAVVAVIGYAMYASGKRDISSDHLVPHRTVRTVKQTPTVMERPT